MNIKLVYAFLSREYLFLAFFIYPHFIISSNFTYCHVIFIICLQQFLRLNYFYECPKTYPSNCFTFLVYLFTLAHQEYCLLFIKKKHLNLSMVLFLFPSVQPLLTLLLFSHLGLSFYWKSLLREILEANE